MAIKETGLVSFSERSCFRNQKPESAPIAVVLVGLLCSSSALALELRGFPVKLDGKVDRSSPAIGDIDGDGQLDIAICTASQVVAIDNSGAPLDGFPFTLVATTDDAELRNPASPALCDLNADGRREIVVGGPDKLLHAFSTGGTELAGFPVVLGSRASAAPACADVNGDSRPDILVATDDGKVHVIQSDGTELPSFKQDSFAASASSFIVADLIADTKGLEIAIGGTDGKLHAFSATGKRLPGFPLATEYAVSAGAVAGDINGDGQWDLVFGSEDFGVYAAGADGKLMAGFPVKTSYRIYGSPALGDINGDGVTDIVVGSADGKIYAFRGDGKAISGWPVDTRARVYSSPAIADLDRDGRFEVVVASSSGMLHVLTATGKAFPGYPVRIGGELKTSPVAVDLDGNGTLEVVISSANGMLHAYSFVPSGKAAIAAVEWSGYGHDCERVSRMRPNRSVFLEPRIEPANPKTSDELSSHYVFRNLDATAEKDTRVRWYRNGKHVAELDDKRVVPAAMTHKGEKWRFSLQDAADFKLFGTALGSHIVGSAETRILNTIPTAPQIAFTTDVMRTGDELVVTIAKPSIDADEDKVLYRIRWMRNREPNRELSGQFKVPPQLTRKDQVWEAIVIPFDGQDEGLPTRIATTIANTAPRAPKISLLPSKPKISDVIKVRIDQESADADGDKPAYRYQWSVDGIARPLASDLNSIPASIASKNKTIEVVVTPYDNVDSGAEAKVQVKVVNTVPPAPQLELVPQSARTIDDLIVRIVPNAADNDKDNVSYAVEWTKDGKIIEGQTSPRLPAEQTTKGQRIKVSVVPSDGEHNGVVSTATVVVGNTPPGPADVSISPAAPKRGDALKAQIVRPAVDVDKDTLQYRWSWLRDGAVVEGLNGDSVPAGIVKKNEVWRAKVVAYDGVDTGAAGAFDVRIGDTVASKPSIGINPAQPKTTDDMQVLVKTSAVDVDGDDVSYKYAWFLDGVRQAFDEKKSVLPSEQTRKGQQWMVEVTPVTDQNSGEPARLSLRIFDTAPKPPKLNIFPLSPSTKDVLMAQVQESTIDVDGDPITVRVHWLLDGVLAGIEGTQVEASRTKRGQRWTAVAVASDGELESVPSKVDVVIRNSPPSAPQMAIDSPAFTTDQDIELRMLKPSVDDDGDAVQYRYIWLLNNRDVGRPADARRLPMTDTKKAQQWLVRVIPNDGTEDGLETLVPLEISNTPPRKAVISLHPQQALTSDPLLVKIDVAAPDADNDAIKYNYRWFKNGIRQRVDETSGRLDPKLTSRGDRWRVEVRAFDGEVEGEFVSAELLVGNSRPASPKIAIKPVKPMRGESLQCAVLKKAEDADNDELIYRFFWQKNGKPVSEGVDGIIPAALVEARQNWSCSAEATDGQLVGDRVDAAPVLVQNSGPSVPTLSLTPAEPRASEPLRCAIAVESQDPDGDPVSYVFSWRKGKSKKVLFDGQQVLPEGSLKKREKWTCVATASDGELRSKDASVTTTIVNSIPSAPTIVLEPSNPTAQLDELRCVIGKDAVDADGDRLRYRVAWFKDGVVQDFADTTLEVPARLVVDKSLWQCTVSVSDGKADSATASSNTVLVGSGK